MHLALSPRAQRLATPVGLFHVESYRLGMPHLSLGSLSESWLLKELGHRHWLLLAAMAGREVPDFRDAGGAPVYAAFRALSLADVDLGAFREHDGLLVASTIRRISRSQFVSSHTLRQNGSEAGQVELCSVFVTRRQPGRNRSIARIALDGFGPIGDLAAPCITATLADAIATGRRLRQEGFSRDAAGTGPRLVINPCPAKDFNGADFLYFVSIQAFVDRAEWEMLGADAGLATTTARDIVYHGNIEIGDRVVVELCGCARRTLELRHWYRIHREADAAPLADVLTRRRLRARPA